MQHCHKADTLSSFRSFLPMEFGYGWWIGQVIPELALSVSLCCWTSKVEPEHPKWSTKCLLLSPFSVLAAVLGQQENPQLTHLLPDSCEKPALIVRSISPSATGTYSSSPIKLSKQFKSPFMFFVSSQSWVNINMHHAYVIYQVRYSYWEIGPGYNKKKTCWRESSSGQSFL